MIVIMIETLPFINQHFYSWKLTVAVTKRTHISIVIGLSEIKM